LSHPTKSFLGLDIFKIGSLKIFSQDWL
jgi:hypothetical protein